jgi:hypothetical protein
MEITEYIEHVPSLDIITVLFVRDPAWCAIAPKERDWQTCEYSNRSISTKTLHSCMIQRTVNQRKETWSTLPRLSNLRKQTLENLQSLSLHTFYSAICLRDIGSRELMVRLHEKLQISNHFIFADMIRINSKSLQQLYENWQ